MSNIFFCYNNNDRNRIEHIVESLTKEGYISHFEDDQLNPDRVELDGADCCIMFWSLSSAASSTILDQARSAKKQNKLIHIMLDTLLKAQIPEDLAPKDPTRLPNWTGDTKNSEWKKLISEIQSLVTPKWVKDVITEKDSTLASEIEKTHLLAAECEILKQNLEKETQAHNLFRQNRATVFAEVDQSKSEIKNLSDQLSAATTENETLSAERYNNRKRKYTHAQFLASLLLVAALGSISIFAVYVYPLQKQKNMAALSIKNAETKMSARSAEINELNSTIEKQKSDYASSHERTASLNKKVNGLEDELRINQQKLKTSSSEIEKEKAKLKTQDQQYASSRQREALLIAEQKRLEGELAKTENNLNTTKAKLEQAGAKIQLEEKQVGAKQQQITKLLKQQKQQHNDLKTSEENLKNTISKLNSTQQKLTSTETSLENAIAEKNKINALLTSAETQLKTNDKRQKQIDKELSAAKSKLATYDDDLATFKRNAYEEIARVKAKASKKVEDMQKRLNQIKAQKKPASQ